MDKYSPSEFVNNCICFVRSKLYFKNCRFIRFPFYIRGRRSLVGGKGLTLGRFCRFEMDGSKKSLYIGNNCEMGDMTHIVALNKVEIGNNVLLASKCFISDTSHGVYSEVPGFAQSSPNEHPNDRILYSEPVFIGDDVWIGENSVILPGSVIEDGAIIGANSVVRGRIPSNCIAVGAPAKVKKEYHNNAWIRALDG